MATKNDVTGDAIQSKVSSQTFRDNWDKIDWSKKPNQVLSNQHGSHATEKKEDVSESK